MFQYARENFIHKSNAYINGKKFQMIKIF